MTIYLPVSNTLSASARAALLDHLNSTPLSADLLDAEDGWTTAESLAAAEELEAAGYGKNTDGVFYPAFELRAPEQLPTDLLDELVPAVEAIDSVVQDVMNRRTPEDPNPDNPLGVSWAVLMQLQNVLLIAKYHQQGVLTGTDINTQLPAVAVMLAKAIRSQVPQ